MQLKEIKPFLRFKIQDCLNPMFCSHIINQRYAGLIEVFMITGVCQGQTLYMPENTHIFPCGAS